MSAPAPGADDWHREHAFADVCAVCHGGDPDARDAAAAHAAMTPPLADPAARCGTCHGAAASELAARYARYERARAADAGAPLSVRADRGAPPRPELHGRPFANVVAGFFALAVALGGGAWIARRERARRSSC